MVEFSPSKKMDDPELRARYADIVGIGQRIFGNSALTNSSLEVESQDLVKIGEFLGECSPERTGWRLKNQFPKESDVEGRLSSKKYADWSSFGNWSEAGGPLESFELASESSAIILDLILKNPKEDGDSRVSKTLEVLQHSNSNLLRSAGLLHDVGRLLTHLFLTNEKIGNLMLRKIGIRDDIVSILPDEKVMLTPHDQSMDSVIQEMNPNAVIIRIADELGKRFPGSQRLYRPEDFDESNREQWARNYIGRPPTGRASDRKMRSKMPLHVSNVQRYMEGLDKWVRDISTIDGLNEISNTLNTQLSPVLAPLPKN